MFSFADQGAQYVQGEVNIITRNKDGIKGYTTNYVIDHVLHKFREDSRREEQKLYKILPIMENVNINNWGSEYILDERWRHFNMGLGNNLFIRDYLETEFYKRYTDDTPLDEIFETWVEFAKQVLISKTKIIGLGEMGKNIIDEILKYIPYMNSLIIDDLKEIDKDKEYEINDFLSNTDVVFVVGLINYNTDYILNLIADIVYIDIFPIVILTAKSSDADVEILRNIIPNTFIIKNYAFLEIYKILINLLISTSSQSPTSRYEVLIDTSIADIKNILSYGKTFHIGFGSNIGIDGTRDLVSRTMLNLNKDINISEIKSILFLFRLSKHIGLFEVEESIEIFKEKFNYANDTLFLCITDEQMMKNESEVILITTTN